jgi:hypothetical protein
VAGALSRVSGDTWAGYWLALRLRRQTSGLKWKVKVKRVKGSQVTFMGEAAGEMDRP